MLPTGRERRRRDLYGRVRRFLYGPLLLAAAPGTVASDELAALGKLRLRRDAATASRHAVIATLQGLIVVHAEAGSRRVDSSAGHAGEPRLALDSVTARLPESADAPLFRVAVAEGRPTRDGIGFDLAVPDIGDFHFNLHARRNAGSKNTRDDLAGAEAALPTWCVGGTLELVRAAGGGRHVAAVPELRCDLSEQPQNFLPFQASLRLAQRQRLGGSLDERVPQLTFKWRL